MPSDGEPDKKKRKVTDSDENDLGNAKMRNIHHLRGLSIPDSGSLPSNGQVFIKVRIYPPSGSSSLSYQPYTNTTLIVPAAIVQQHLIEDTKSLQSESYQALRDDEIKQMTRLNKNDAQWDKKFQKEYLLAIHTKEQTFLEHFYENTRIALYNTITFQRLKDESENVAWVTLFDVDVDSHWLSDHPDQGGINVQTAVKQYVCGMKHLLSDAEIDAAKKGFATVSLITNEIMARLGQLDPNALTFAYFTGGKGTRIMMFSPKYSFIRFRSCDPKKRKDMVLSHIRSLLGNEVFERVYTEIEKRQDLYVYCKSFEKNDHLFDSAVYGDGGTKPDLYPHPTTLLFSREYPLPDQGFTTDDIERTLDHLATRDYRPTPYFIERMQKMYNLVFQHCIDKFDEIELIHIDAPRARANNFPKRQKKRKENNEMQEQDHPLNTKSKLRPRINSSNEQLDRVLRSIFEDEESYSGYDRWLSKEMKIIDQLMNYDQDTILAACDVFNMTVQKGYKPVDDNEKTMSSALAKAASAEITDFDRNVDFTSDTHRLRYFGSPTLEWEPEQNSSDNVVNKCEILKLKLSFITLNRHPYLGNKTTIFKALVMTAAYFADMVKRKDGEAGGFIREVLKDWGSQIQSPPPLHETDVDQAIERGFVLVEKARTRNANSGSTVYAKAVQEINKFIDEEMARVGFRLCVKGDWDVIDPEIQKMHRDKQVLNPVQHMDSEALNDPLLDLFKFILQRDPCDALWVKDGLKQLKRMFVALVYVFNHWIGDTGMGSVGTKMITWRLNADRKNMIRSLGHGSS
ncbi:hypothetical protein GUITHDRAFT_110025 [Guillardia theta CCMP2712]|uniref:Uncharacterized protein n=1 Tax=Guillardia theta (strain CCMP2712) TaxID=905079 RepID=L1J6H1_GUITC|nr:hypothetical protein GUITHDRAFT_110025 [Guillardia theta CCMP2712]EKX43912.1 hypothetical protein GUITHDRAFT_110025 [Guillardia theta CCMP2712]|eukprot:XP_005830892.1 hypothetical protein GUITHDRAFT_110025 [Guillardia theta CCMP2712]